jgi:hypothetical protein
MIKYLLIFYIDVYIPTENEEGNDFEIVEKIEMVSEETDDIHLIKIIYSISCIF